jgi:hypothetical protein
LLGKEEANLLVEGRQRKILENALPSAVPPLPSRPQKGDGWLKRLFGR